MLLLALQWRRGPHLTGLGYTNQAGLLYVLAFVPFLDSTVLTTYTDPDQKIVYPLYGDHPSVQTFIANMLLLNYGPGQINILGLYVALVAVTPLLLWLLYHGRVRLLLALSWGMYFVHAAYPIRALPFQSENAFPVLTWQLLFVHGLVAGYCRQQLVALARGRFGRPLLASAIVMFLLLSFFALNNPWYDIPGPTRFSFIPEPTYAWIYTNFFDRTTLGLGRFVNTLVVVGVLYAVLTRYWTPCRTMLGWLCIPMGQATLYVFVVHLIFVLGAYNLTPLWGNSLLINTLAHTLSIILIWVMVSTRFLFRWIPR